MAARETGVVRQRLDGDTAAAQRLKGIARTQLGILKELMAFGGLQQLSRTVRLGDGTEIFVQSVFGQDTVRITPPVAAVEVAGGAEEVVTQGRYVYVAGTDGIRTYRWKIGVDGRRLISTIDVGIAPSDVDLLMSADGSVIVVGYYDSVSGTNKVYRWTESGGVNYLEMSYVPSGIGYGHPSVQMSSDGSVVAVGGYDVSIGASKTYRWTASSGVVDLGISSLQYGGREVAWSMSTDGSVIAVIANDPASITGASVVVWTSESKLTVPGIVPDSSVAVGSLAVSADGTAVFASGYVGAGYHMLRWTRSEGTIDSGATSDYQSYVSPSSDGSSVVFCGFPNAYSICSINYWNRVSGAVDTGLRIVSGSYQPAAISSDGTRLLATNYVNGTYFKPTRWSVAGAEDSGITLKYSQNVELMITADGAINSFSGGDVSFHAYRWANPGTPIDLGSVGTGGSTVMVMSPDGSILVGTSSGSHTMWTPDERFAFAASASQYSPKAITKVFYE